jgi:hypothetical protein
MRMENAKTLKPRTNLREEVKERLRDLYSKIGLPQLRDRLSLILTSQEKQVIHWETLHDTGLPIDAANEILFAVAEQREMSLERALIELAHDLDLLGSGSYKVLRRSINEPMDERMDDLPDWDASAGELSLGGEVIRHVSSQAKNLRTILNAFQEDQWKHHVDNPLPGGADSRKLRQTVYNLNEGLSGIKFFSAGGAKRVQWQWV